MNIADLQSRIADVWAIHITTPDIEQSYVFYQKLGFKEMFRYDFPFPFILITDDTILIMLRKDPVPYMALTYYVKNVEDKVRELENEGFIFTALSQKSDMIQRFKTASPDGLNLTLVTYVETFIKPAGPTMLRMNQSDYFNPEKYVNKAIGMFGELAHPVKDLEQSILYWEKLGFSTVSKFSSPYPWAILSDGTAVIGCHQSTHFSAPAITYFAKDMGDKIAHLKEKGLENYKEMMGPHNIAITTPEGQQVFLFSMG